MFYLKPFTLTSDTYSTLAGDRSCDWTGLWYKMVQRSHLKSLFVFVFVCFKSKVAFLKICIEEINIKQMEKKGLFVLLSSEIFA